MAIWPRAVLMSGLLCLAIAAGASASTTERRVLTEINDYRAAHGVRPVRASTSLARSARRYARHVLRTDRVRHDDHIWTSSRFRLAGENIAWQRGKRRGARSVVRMWARSSAHRKVLLNPRYSWGGVGRKYGRLGSRRATVWVLHLGRR